MSGKRMNKPSVDEHYVRPQAAWEQMKAARNTGQTVYIYGATGTGKTSFVADFLARKQYCYLSVADTDIIKMAGIVWGKTEQTHEKTYGQKIIVIDDFNLTRCASLKTDCLGVKKAQRIPIKFR